MNLLNDIYNKSCKPKCESYKQVANNILLIDNFFENFELARSFFLSREKWKCISYQGNSKPGYESLFPLWVGTSLMEKFILDHKIIDDMNSYETTCNFFYNESSPLWSISNSGYFPHIDSVQNGDVLNYICLINLNDTPVSTKFYTYENQEYCTIETYKEWEEYTKDIKKELRDYYGKKTITREESKVFLDKKQDLKVKLDKEVEYKSNQAIVYSSNLFHSPSVTQEFTKDNPRSLLRICFDRKIVVSEKTFNYS